MEEVRSQWSSLNPPGGVFLFLGSHPLGWEKALATVAVLSSPKTFGSFGILAGERCVLFGRMWAKDFSKLLNIVVTNEEPISGYNDVRSVDIPKGAFWEKYGHTNCKTTFSPSSRH